jgi:hypothetical protein
MKRFTNLIIQNSYENIFVCFISPASTCDKGIGRNSPQDTRRMERLGLTTNTVQHKFKQWERKQINLKMEMSALIC